MSIGRFYFLRDGKELTGHPLNGVPFEGTGPWVIRDGKRVKERQTITYFKGRREWAEITAADFDNKPVTVKLWFPEKDACDTFTLVPGGAK
jgi:hypothetical protein